jgi:hypothetical protein
MDPGLYPRRGHRRTAGVGVDHLSKARRVASIMDRAMERVTGAVPVACELALSRRWFKRAKAVYLPGGQLLPCEIDLF